MKEQLKMVIVLTTISVISAFFLAFTKNMTEERIRSISLMEKKVAIDEVMLPYDNNPFEEVFSTNVSGSVWNFYIGRKDNRITSVAFEGVSKAGYGGDILFVVGINMTNGTIHSLKIISHKETPGLGAKITEEGFLSQFINKPIEKTKWMVNKDGGDIHAITSATISSRAVTDSIKKGLEILKFIKEQVR